MYQTLCEVRGIGRIQLTTPTSTGKKYPELLFPLPVWPLALDKQFYRFLEREPWHRKDMYYLKGPAHEPRPILSTMDWGRFFYSRYQAGFGTREWTTRKVVALLCVGKKERAMLAYLGHIAPECFEDIMPTVLAPLHESFYYEPLTYRQLFHRNTLRKMQRLGLLEEEDIHA
jgi:hypothetical protein